MYTEEDTFSALKRTPFADMLRMILPRCKVGESVATKGKELDLLEPNGWTAETFNAYFNREGSSEIFSIEINRSYGR